MLFVTHTDRVGPGPWNTRVLLANISIIIETVNQSDYRVCIPVHEPRRHCSIVELALVGVSNAVISCFDRDFPFAIRSITGNHLTTGPGNNGLAGVD